MKTMEMKYVIKLDVDGGKPLDYVNEIDKVIKLMVFQLPSHLQQRNVHLEIESVQVDSKPDVIKKE